jgi:PIN domain nuclease of toxin-antitoxin system
MKVLLDTCALIALSNGPLPKASAQAFGRAAVAYVSTASIWEAAIKWKSGKLNLPDDPLTWFRKLTTLYRLTEFVLDAELVSAAAELPLMHADPFDRALVALARREGLTILTADRLIQQYPAVKTLW